MSKTDTNLSDEFTVTRDLLQYAALVFREAGREDTNGYRTITALLNTTTKES